MISEVCHEVKNWFCAKRIFGKFKVEGGVLRFLDNPEKDIALQDKQYYRIVNSTFNDGVWKYEKNKPNNELMDEIFSGAIWFMAVPRDFLNLVEKIAAWDAKYGNLDSAAQSPFSSESFGGYSYSKASGGNGSGSGSAITWKDNFKSELNKWRKI